MPTIPYKNKAGKRLRGATTHIGQNVGWGKDGLIFWANEQGREGFTLDESRNTATIPGTIAHLLIECDLKGTIPDLNKYTIEQVEKARVSYYEYLRWRDNYKVIPVAIEPNLICEEYQYGATPDLIAQTTNGIALIDWKTGKTYSTLFLQLESYRFAWEENNPDKKITGGYHCLRIPRNEETPSFHHSYWESIPQIAWEAFNCSLILSKAEKELKKLL